MANMMMAEKVDVKVADGGLAQVMKMAKVHEELIQLFKDEGVENLMEFSSFFTRDKYEDEAVTYRDKVESLKTRQIEVSRLRAAIGLARAVIDRPARPQNGQAPAMDEEAPLDPEEKENMAKAWTARYGIRLSMWLDPAEGLVNLLYRQFRHNNPKILGVTSIRSTYSDNDPHPETRVMLGGGLSMTLQGQKTNEVVRDVSQYYFALRVLANASAKAGNYEFDSKVEKNTKVIFAPLDVNLDYADFAFRKTLSTGIVNATAMKNWLEERDRYTRGLMCNNMKAGYPQGEALQAALKETEIMWASTGPLRTSEFTRRSPPPVRTGGASGSQGGQVAKVRKPQIGKTQRATHSGMGKGTGGKGGGVTYASTLKGGKKLCRAFNLGNCPNDPCPYGGAHQCNVVQNGRVCGGKHPSSRHSFGGQGR